MATTVSTRPQLSAAQALPGHHHNEAQGRRLNSAFEALDGFPMLAGTRQHVLDLFDRGTPDQRELVDAIEGDAALAIAVLRSANNSERGFAGEIDTVPQALDAISPEGVLAIVSSARTFDFFERTAVWQNAPERFRVHAIATQRAAQEIAIEVAYEHRDRLMLTALLHDIGKLALGHSDPDYPRQVHGSARTPEERAAREQAELGVDHALVGGVIARRWGLPATISQAIESHHNACEPGEAAIIRLADMLAHYGTGGFVSRSEMSEVAGALGLNLARIRAILYVLGRQPDARRLRQVAPCPMSTREVDVLRCLSRGLVYKQIASELGLSTSTVRTHLHNVYGKLGANDRAQAVLIATERGWL